mmetsp:Transcript_30512/g.66940  ORF Transcript_30512/g.66940 Transcript_30512/m.66940 type:complete len:266 (+) Transcript_30512:312-1109(+)
MDATLRSSRDPSWKGDNRVDKGVPGVDFMATTGPFSVSMYGPTDRRDSCNDSSAMEALKRRDTSCNESRISEASWCELRTRASRYSLTPDIMYDDRSRVVSSKEPPQQSLASCEHWSIANPAKYRSKPPTNIPGPLCREEGDAENSKGLLPAVLCVRLDKVGDVSQREALLRADREKSLLSSSSRDDLLAKDTRRIESKARHDKLECISDFWSDRRAFTPGLVRLDSCERHSAWRESSTRGLRSGDSKCWRAGSPPPTPPAPQTL